MKPLPPSKENSTSPGNPIVFPTFLFLGQQTTHPFNKSTWYLHPGVSILWLAYSNSFEFYVFLSDCYRGFLKGWTCRRGVFLASFIVTQSSSRFRFEEP